MPYLVPATPERVLSREEYTQKLRMLAAAAAAANNTATWMREAPNHLHLAWVLQPRVQQATPVKSEGKATASTSQARLGAPTLHNARKLYPTSMPVDDAPHAVISVASTPAIAHEVHDVDSDDAELVGCSPSPHTSQRSASVGKRARASPRTPASKKRGRTPITQMQLQSSTERDSSSVKTVSPATAAKQQRATKLEERPDTKRPRTIEDWLCQLP